MIVCDRCMKNRVEVDGDMCEECTEFLRPKTVLDYLKSYRDLLEDYDTYKIIPRDDHLQGLKDHIERLEMEETKERLIKSGNIMDGSRHCGQC